MDDAKLYLIFLDVFNANYETLTRRAALVASGNSNSIYVGDYTNYTVQLFISNGWRQGIDPPAQINKLLNAIVCKCCQDSGVNAAAEWSDDMEYIYFT